MADPGEPIGPLDLSPGDGGERRPPISVGEGQTVGGPPPPPPKRAPRTKAGPASVTGRSKSRPRRASAESSSSDEGESNGSKVGGAGVKPGPSWTEPPQVESTGEVAPEDYNEGGPSLHRRRLDFTEGRPKDRIPGNPVEIADVVEIGKYFDICIGKSKWQVEKKATWSKLVGEIMAVSLVAIRQRDVAIERCNALQRDLLRKEQRQVAEGEGAAGPAVGGDSVPPPVVTFAAVAARSASRRAGPLTPEGRAAVAMAASRKMQIGQLNCARSLEVMAELRTVAEDLALAILCVQEPYSLGGVDPLDSQSAVVVSHRGRTQWRLYSSWTIKLGCLGLNTCAPDTRLWLRSPYRDFPLCWLTNTTSLLTPLMSTWGSSGK